MSLQYQQETPSESLEPHEGYVTVRSPLPVLSFVLIAFYTAVFAVQMVTDLDQSIYRAGEDKDIIAGGHEVWRVLTGATLHGGVLHYGFNTYAFYSFGRTFEMLTNRWHVAIVFLLSALGGALLSFAVSPHGISVGASGGIIGLVGYLAVYSFKRRDFITPEFRRSLIFNIGFILFYGFVLVRAVDNFAHIGGLVTGAIYALVMVPKDSYEDPRIASATVETLGLFSLASYGVICLFSILVILRVI